jgi:CheY-like chemotaxis protein
MENKNKAIVCVDDETIILDCLIEQLSNMLGDGYIFETAESADEGQEVIDELHEEGIDVKLLISDWLMPEKKGDEFLIDIHKDYPDIKKIILTGHAEEKALDKAVQKANLQAVIHKPWSSDEFLEIIKNLDLDE